MAKSKRRVGYVAIAIPAELENINSPLMVEKRLTQLQRELIRITQRNGKRGQK